MDYNFLKGIAKMRLNVVPLTNDFISIAMQEG